MRDTDHLISHGSSVPSPLTREVASLNLRAGLVLMLLPTLMKMAGRCGAAANP
jgi:hypothetical protein